MKILITGSNGFIAQHIIKVLVDSGKHNIIATSRDNDRSPLLNSPFYKFENLDITNEKKVSELITFFKPQIIIHAAANGSADSCESNKPACDVTNVSGTQFIVNAANIINAKVIFLSTDFIFNGENGPYSEDDIPNPINYYGESKLKAERYITSNCNDFCTLRLCSVYGPAYFGRPRGIMTLTIDKLSKGKTLKAVSDQVRTPTYVGDIAKATLQIIDLDIKGTFHISGEETFTPFHMAISTAYLYKLDPELIIKVNSIDLDEPAKRPLITGFIINKAKQAFNFKPISFEDGLRKMENFK